MWESFLLWPEIAIVSTTFTLGHVFFGHFEERTSKYRKLLKFVFTLILISIISIYFGRLIALILFACMFIPVLYIHLILLPKNDINGWTGEPKSKYYDYRGWDTNIFDNKDSNKK